MSESINHRSSLPEDEEEAPAGQERDDDGLPVHGHLAAQVLVRRLDGAALRHRDGRAGLAGDDVEATVEIDVRRLDDGQVPHGEARQNPSTVPPRGGSRSSP